MTADRRGAARTLEVRVISELAHCQTELQRLERIVDQAKRRLHRIRRRVNQLGASGPPNTAHSRRRTRRGSLDDTIIAMLRANFRFAEFTVPDVLALWNSLNEAELLSASTLRGILARYRSQGLIAVVHEGTRGAGKWAAFVVCAHEDGLLTSNDSETGATA